MKQCNSYIWGLHVATQCWKHNTTLISITLWEYVSKWITQLKLWCTSKWLSDRSEQPLSEDAMTTSHSCSICYLFEVKLNKMQIDKTPYLTAVTGFWFKTKGQWIRDYVLKCQLRGFRLMRGKSSCRKHNIHSIQPPEKHKTKTRKQLECK